MNGKLLVSLLILAHLLADFLLQSKVLADDKKKSSWSLLVHSLWVGITSFVLTVPYFSRRLLIVILLVMLSHFLLDYLKIKVEEKGLLNGFLSFFSDQLAHILVIIALYPLLVDIKIQQWSLSIYKLINEYYPYLSSADFSLVDFYILVLIISAYIFIWTPGSMIVTRILRNYKADSTFLCMTAGEKSEAINPGELIGKLERTLLLTLVLSQGLLAIPVVFAAKSVARFNNFKDKSFVDYYIVGTFVSLLVALGVGVILNILINVEQYSEHFILYRIF